uniref:RCC1-like domain-containing protein n=1 Tax=Chenopodium quinoa TaxID=63459 RepID=A0A803MWB3_CHEQI
MECSLSPRGHKQSPQSHGRKSVLGGTQKDIWLIVKEGCLADVELALTQLKKNGGNINLRNAFGLTPLHIATWRNHIPIVRRLLAAGADPDARDGESGWSSLHRALYFGHFAVAGVLLQSGASISIEDFKLRTPIDLLSGPLSQILGNQHASVTTEVLSWGSGTNYQLGTGNAHIQKLPCKLDALHGSFIKLISASKFHSVAVSGRGELYTWGFGRGGRLGHPEFDIHSGQAAVITPRQVVSGLGSRRVKAVAAAKHHTVIATESGEVFTWGSNREGQLGYASVDTQPTPRRVSSLKSKIVAVAAANKHTAAVSEIGEVFTWGCNKEGQLGYGTSNSSSNNTPRLVEYLKGKFFTAVSAAKYHTVVLGADGEVFTWGHRLVTPRRVIIARNLKKNGNALMKFHRMERLHVVSIATGMVHSMALTDDGALFYWISSDPDLKCQQLCYLNGKKIVSISAGKYWHGAVTSTGDIYMWDGKKAKDKPPEVTRLHGVKRATKVSVGETHLLIVGSTYHPAYPVNAVQDCENLKPAVSDVLGELDEGFMYNDMESDNAKSGVKMENVGDKVVPSLKGLCEKVAAQCLVEPRNALQMLEIADTLDAGDLRKYCEEIVIRNFDYIFTASLNTVATASLEILAHVEKVLDVRSSESWSHRRLPTPTATFPAVLNSEVENSDSESPRTRDNNLTVTYSAKKAGCFRLDNFLQPMNVTNQEVSKQIRVLRKKLQQIEVLEAKQSKGHILDDQQIAKLETRPALESSLAELGVPIETTIAKSSVSVVSDGKVSKAGKPKKQRRKSRHEESQTEAYSGTELESNHVKVVADLNLSKLTEGKVPAEPEDSFTKGSQNLSLEKDSPGVGPAWGGSKVSKMSSSLREIQNEQSKLFNNRPLKNKEKPEELPDRSSGKFLLSSLLASNPIPVAPARTTQLPDGDKSTPPWAASGTPPHLSRPSLRDIQMQQGKNQSVAHSPKTKTTGFAVTTGQGSPSESGSQSRWFKPEVESTSSIRSIQIEEKAIKDFRRFYSSVRIVKNQS